MSEIPNEEAARLYKEAMHRFECNGMPQNFHRTAEDILNATKHGFKDVDLIVNTVLQVQKAMCYIEETRYVYDIICE